MVKRFIARFLGRTQKPVIIVSGLPRSGTSLVMQMLEAGGLEPYTDSRREPDADNPKGYLEHERAKELSSAVDKTWVREAAGKALKVISYLLTDLPAGVCYRVVFVRRDLDEVIASQNKMLERRQQPLAEDDARTREMFENHLEKISNWIRCQPNFEVVEIDYSEIIASPEDAAERLRKFIGGNLDAGRMARAVEPALYRNRIRASDRLP